MATLYKLLDIQPIPIVLHDTYQRAETRCIWIKWGWHEFEWLFINHTGGANAQIWLILQWFKFCMNGSKTKTQSPFMHCSYFPLSRLSTKMTVLIRRNSKLNKEEITILSQSRHFWILSFETNLDTRLPCSLVYNKRSTVYDTIFTFSLISLIDINVASLLIKTCLT